MTNCTSGYTKGLKKLSFHFPEDVELKKMWIYFVNRKEWTPTLNSVIYVEHFESKYLKYGKKHTLKWELHAIPTILLTKYLDRHEGLLEKGSETLTS